MSVNLNKGKIDSSLNIDKEKSKIEIIGYTGSDSTAATLFAWEEIHEDLGGGKILNIMNFYLSDTKDVDEWKKYKITVEEIT